MALRLHEVAPRREGWEYQRLSMLPDPAADMASLNGAGADGWEVIDVAWLYRFYMLKRRT